MRQTISLSLLLLLAAMLLPLAFVGVLSPPAISAPPESAEPATSPTPQPLRLPLGARDRETVFTVLSAGGEVREVNMAEYLPGVVAAEMPAAFETEALKAQAVAARTYIIYRMSAENPRHPQADVCDDPGCCKAFSDEAALREKWGGEFEAYMSKVAGAVLDTDGEYLVYEGLAIQAVFHSSSPGQTEASGSLWEQLPYLVSVSSPETAEAVPNFVTTVEVSPGDFKDTVLMSFPEAKLSGGAEGWLGKAEHSIGGRVENILVGGVEIPGAQVRSMFALRSAAFTVTYTGQSFLFTVTGYGHGVGMSQYGANIMASQGNLYDAILAHYYPGTTLLRGN